MTVGSQNFCDDLRVTKENRDAKAGVPFMKDSETNVWTNKWRTVRIGSLKVEERPQWRAALYSGDVASRRSGNFPLSFHAVATSRLAQPVNNLMIFNRPAWRFRAAPYDEFIWFTYVSSPYPFRR